VNQSDGAATKIIMIIVRRQGAVKGFEPGTRRAANDESPSRHLNYQTTAMCRNAGFARLKLRPGPLPSSPRDDADDAGYHHQELQAAEEHPADFGPEDQRRRRGRGHAHR
jgi:hypothetical protein